MFLKFAAAAVAIACVSNLSSAFACDTEDLWRNVNWCNNPDGKDGLQREGRNRILDGIENKKAVQVLVGYLQCQHHQIPAGSIRSSVESAFGIGGSDPAVGRFMNGFMRELGNKTGEPFSQLRYCSLGDLYKMAFYVTHNVNAGGTPNDGRPHDVYKIEGQSCEQFMEDKVGSLDVDDACHAIVDPYWLTKVGG